MRILFWVAVAMSVRCPVCAFGWVFSRRRRASVLRRPAPWSYQSGTAVLLDDVRHDAGADRAATLADGETEAGVHGDRLDELDLHLDVVTRHHHLDALGQVGHARDVGGAEVELRPIAREERRVAAAL